MKTESAVMFHDGQVLFMGLFLHSMCHFLSVGKSISVDLSIITAVVLQRTGMFFFLLWCSLGTFEPDWYSFPMFCIKLKCVQECEEYCGWRLKVFLRFNLFLCYKISGLHIITLLVCFTQNKQTNKKPDIEEQRKK